MNLEAIIFDLDGTLIDSMGIWKQVDIDFLAKRNLKVPNDLFKDLKGGNSLNEIAIYFKNKFSLKESIEDIQKEWIQQVSHYYKNKIKIKPGVTNFLNIYNKYKKAIGTSNLLQLAKDVLKSNGIINCFDAIVAGNKNIKGKPHPDIFLEAAKKLNVNPKNCIVIEDVLEGVLAAKAANMKVIAIYDAHAENLAEIKKNADIYVNSYTEVQAYIQKIIK